MSEKEQNERRPQAVPLSRTLSPGRLSRAEALPLDIRAETAELAALAAFVGVEAISRLRFKGFLRPRADEAWEAEGRLTAEVTQPCVVTLEPVDQRIDERISRLYLPEGADAPALGADFGLDDEDEPETFGHAIELGNLIVESLALALDPYPRAENAELPEISGAPPGAGHLDDDVVKPFAKLAALKETLQNKKS